MPTSALFRLAVALTALLGVVGCDGDGDGDGDTDVAGVALHDLEVAYSSATSVHLSWANDAQGNDGVLVERAPKADGNFVALEPTLAADATEADDDGLELSKRYHYRVRPVTDGVPGEPSEVVTADPPPVPEDPASPTSVNATALNANAIQVDWEHDGADVKGFRVERLMNYEGLSAIQVADLPAVTRTFTDTCLRPGTPYLYTVTAYNEAGATVSVTTPSNTWTAAPAGAPTPASTPTNLRATPLTDDSFRIEWDNACPSAADRIFVEVSVDGGAYANVLGTGAFLSDATFFFYVDVPVGTAHTFRVRAGNDYGNTPYSNTVTVEGPDAPAPAGSGSIGIYADYDNTKTYTDLLPDVNATAYPLGHLRAGCFWSFNTFLGVQDFLCDSAALHFPMAGTDTAGGGFDLTGKTIDRAVLVLSVSSIPIDRTNLQIAAIASPWSTSTLTGDTSLSLYTDGASVQGSPLAWGPYGFDVTTIVQQWASGTFQNHGVLVEDAEFVFPYADLIRTSFFFSSDDDNGNPNNRPTLWVDYH